MQSNLKFDPRRSRARLCPCGKSNKDGKFSPFVGYHDKGHCHSCGKTFFPEREQLSPYQGGVRGNERKRGGITSEKAQTTPHARKAYTRPSLRHPHKASAQEGSFPTLTYIPEAIFKATLQPAQNNFIRFLQSVFGKEITQQLMQRYYIATTSYWKGATVFWQINARGRVCAGKVMLYDSTTGKRLKDHPANWIHSIEKIDGYKLHQCLFGEHLLNLQEHAQKPVAVVESEKTAIIASVYLPQYVWLASGGKTMLGAEKCAALQGRSVTLYPDANAFNEWKAIADKHRYRLSNFHELYSTEAEKQEGVDIADYLLRFEVEQFRVAGSELRVDDANELETLNSKLETFEVLATALTFEDILDVQQYLHEIRARHTMVPQEIWKLFWTIYDNRCDAYAYHKLVKFISLN